MLVGLPDVQALGKIIRCNIVKLLTETYNFGSLKNELLRNMIVISVRYGKLFERLYLDTGLTLQEGLEKSETS